MAEEKQKRILVVDDAPYVRQMFKDVLKTYNYKVSGEASDGEKALKKYRRIKPDIVIMDILMPTLDGISSMKNILEYDSNAKIIVVTAVGKKGLEKECMKVGAKAFLTKPFKIDELLATLKKTLEE